MADIIYDSRKLMVFEDLKYLADFTGKGPEYAQKLWEGMLLFPTLYEEFLYYIDNHCIKDELSAEGYSLTDIYVFMLERYNIINDTGKNTADCRKETMVLETFMGMLELLQNPSEFVKKLEEGRGLDKM